MRQPGSHHEGSPGELAGRDVAPARGVVRFPAHAPAQHLRIAPRAELAPFVAHFWCVAWDLEHPASVATLPHPTLHVVFEQGERARAELVGIPTRPFERTLEGRGSVFGIKFRPAAFRALWERPLWQLADRTLALAEVSPSSDEIAVAIASADTMAARIAIVEPWLSAQLRPLRENERTLRDLVELIAHDASIVRVDDVVRRSGFDRRTLQRHFRELVGVGPKWVVRRYRLHEAAERLKADPTLRLSTLARALGYADQAHFSRDFAASVGEPPQSFRRRVAGARS